MSTPDRSPKSLPISEQDLHALAVLRDSQAHRAALSRFVDVEVTAESTEEVVLHAVLRAGIEAVAHAVEVEGYARIAAEASENRQAAARRRVSV
jgi:hypothetical protein